LSGIYIHIPFCKQACHYCDFHFSTNLSLKEEMIKTICKEIELRSPYLSRKTVETIYFGGGTPSLLSEKELESIFNTIHKQFSLKESIEITLEANPDDLDEKTTEILFNSSVNRLSIGIQTFNKVHLEYLNRIHSRDASLKSVKIAQDKGFSNISIDLIYGIPYSDHSIWNNDLKTALSLDPQHISSYCLTIEDRTVFGNWLKKKKISAAEEEFCAVQFEIMLETLTNNNFEHYEISNFSKPGHYSRHNCSYWSGKSYLGIGPGSHSFNGEEREFNISNNANYISSIKNGTIPSTREKLSSRDKINEYIMTNLRTKWGCSLHILKEMEGFTFNEQMKKIELYEKKALLINNSGILILTNKGKLLADTIIYDLFQI
jgi:oxygen-independent coproporphyrinogen III oxidase